MVRDLLGSPDALRPVTSSAESPQRKTIPVYDVARVSLMEASEAFAQYRAVPSAQMAVAARVRAANTTRQTQQVERYLAAPYAPLAAHPNADQMSPEEVWRHHSAWSARLEAQHNGLLDGVPYELAREAQAKRIRQLRRMVAALYGWER